LVDPSGELFETPPFTGCRLTVQVIEDGIFLQPTDKMHPAGKNSLDNFFLHKIGVGNHMKRQFPEIQKNLSDDLAIILQQVLILRLQCLNGIKMKGGIAENVNGGKTADFKSALYLSGAARPIQAKSVCFFTAFGDVARVESHDTFSNYVFNHGQIEPLKIESVFTVNSEILFAFVGKALHLQEIYLTFDARKQTECVNDKLFATVFETAKNGIVQYAAYDRFNV
jgi:hypothetical protein